MWNCGNSEHKLTECEATLEQVNTMYVAIKLSVSFLISQTISCYELFCEKYAEQDITYTLQS